MASQLFTLTSAYQEVAAGSATIQKVSDHLGTVLLAFGTAVPVDDTASFVFADNQPRYFTTADKIYARTPSGIDVKIVVGG